MRTKPIADRAKNGGTIALKEKVGAESKNESAILKALSFNRTATFQNKEIKIRKIDDSELPWKMIVKPDLVPTWTKYEMQESNAQVPVGAHFYDYQGILHPSALYHWDLIMQTQDWLPSAG